MPIDPKYPSPHPTNTECTLLALDGTPLPPLSVRLNTAGRMRCSLVDLSTGKSEGGVGHYDPATRTLGRDEIEDETD